MIKDLLALSQLETGDKPLHHVPTDVSRLLQSIVDDVKRLDSFQDHQITLNCRTDKWLLADVDELRSAISNLVFNAVKYTPAGTKITINWTVDGQGSVIEVIDDGDGIASHHLERLTERFYRVDNGRDRESGGTGLGLAIVKHIVSRHKGRLEIQSELGEGAAFRCIFPTEKAISAPDI